MKKSFSKKTLSIFILAATGLASFSSIADTDINSTVDLNFRYRFESVSFEGAANDAEASTLRTRATVKTNWNASFDTVIEFDDVSIVGVNDYNSGAGTSPNRTQYPIIADPEGTELNQAFIRYTNNDTKLALGRQRILIGNQRFVGGVGWRQNEQTYDSFTVKTKLNKVNFNYAYIFNVNRIFGETVDAGDNEHNTHLVNADVKLGKGKLSAYYFSIDNEDLVGLSNNTAGVRYDGKVNSFAYGLEFATQSEAGDNPVNYSANYYNLDFKYLADKFTLGAGLEVLGGDATAGKGFTTSLATLHKFQGWADVFLGTPVQGIKDVYLNGSFKANGFNITLIYHDFSTDQGSIDLGSEIDIAVSKKFTDNFSGLLKYADFSSDNANYKSRDKLWLMFTYKI